MDMITVSAKTLDEAITKALLELQTTSDHLYYEVVQKENSGIFGLFGAKPCVIRARVMSETEERAAKKAAAEKAAAEKAAAEKAAAEKAAAEKAAAEKAAAEKAAAEKAAAEKAAAEKAAAEKAAAEKAAAEKAAAEKAAAEKAAAEPEKKQQENLQGETGKRGSEKRDFERRGSDRRKPERREGSRRERSERSSRRTAERPEEPRVIHEEKPRQPVKADPEKVQAAAKDFLVNVFGAMGMEVSVATELNLEEGELLVLMEGEDMGLLIGKRGQTLDSLQYLVSLVVNKETEGYLRVKLDTENYRERRKETLETLARNIAYKVKRTRRPVSLEPMNPYERRIIHSALQNDRFVVTRSEGEDPYRHVVIFLKNDRSGGNGRRDRYPRRDRAERGGNRPAESVPAQEVTVTETVTEVVMEVREPQVPVQNNGSEE